MELKELVKAINGYIKPNLQQLLGVIVPLSNNAQQQLLWEKVAPLIEYEIEELKADPNDTDTLNGIPNQIKRALKKKEALQKELAVIVQQLQQAEATDAPNFSGSKNVVYKSTLQSGRDIQIGDTQTTNNYGNVDKQWNIGEHKGNFNVDNSNHGDQNTTHIKQQINNPAQVNHLPNNQGAVHIGDIINVQQVITQTPNLTTPEKQQLKEQLQQLISNNKIKEALVHLLRLTKNGESDMHNQAILLTNRWNRLKTEKRSGIISSENANIQQNRIMAALLSFMEDIENFS